MRPATDPPCARARPAGARWLDPPAVDEAAVARVAAALGIPREPVRILVRRGVDTEPAIRQFLRPHLGRLHPPARLPDLERAAARVERAVASGETLLVHGDYDADGMSAAALLVRGLRRLGARPVPFVPHRTRDGYDLSEAGLARAREVGASLILTADCGVTACDAVAEAARVGIDVVVTDHHRPGDRLPDAVAVVDPMRADSEYPCPELSGTGVAFKLVQALFERAGLPETERNQHLDLVALGTVADQMPLVDENRILVRAGLRVLARSRKPGLRALVERAGVESGAPVDAETIAFRLAPRLNSVGRIDEASAGLRLLLEGDPAAARRLAAHLEASNAERRAEDARVTREVEARLAREFDPARDRALVVWGDGWHPGVIGIVASRLVERWHRPAVVVAFDGDRGRGSGRSVPGFHLLQALERCGSLLERYGGHRAAAGFTVRRERVASFAEALREAARRELGDREPAEELAIDLDLPLARADAGLERWLARLGPFGPGNRVPLLRARGVRVERAERVGRGEAHLRAVLAADGGRLPAIGFGLGPRIGEVTGRRRFDVAFELRLNRWRGRGRLQARLRDLRPAS